jgi:hypothetical protein
MIKTIFVPSICSALHRILVQIRWWSADMATAHCAKQCSAGSRGRSLKAPSYRCS